MPSAGARSQRTAELCAALHEGEFRLTTSSPTMPLEQINEAFDQTMHEGKTIRTVIHY